MNIQERRITFVSVPSKGVFTKRGEAWDISPVFLKRLAELYIKFPQCAFVSPSMQQYLLLAYMPDHEPRYEDWRMQCEGMLAAATSMVVFTFPGWSDSYGVGEEINFANALGVVIRYLNPENGELTATPQVD